MNKLPRHKFWGAGEPDCPADLKAPNGELHTMRCKVCGDGWRKSVDVCFATPSAERAVAQPAEPIAWTVAGEVTNWARDFSKYRTQHYVRPVFAAPSGAQRQPLTDDERKDAR